MDITGNPFGTGGPGLQPGVVPTVETTGSATVGGASLFVDVVVDEVDPVDGMAGFGFNVLYDPAVINILTGSWAPFMLGASVDFSAPNFPSAGGNLRTDPGQAPPTPVWGEGVLIRLELSCVGAGQTYLDLTDLLGGDGTAGIVDSTITDLSATATGDAQMACDTVATPGVPAPALLNDLEIISETITGLASTPINTSTAYTLTKSVVNNGTQTVAATLATGIIPPADCTTTIDSTPLAILVSPAPPGTPGVQTGSPPVVTVPLGHSLVAGDAVIISGVVGSLTTGPYTTAASNDVNHLHTVAAAPAPTATTFALAGVDVLASGSGGTVTPVIATPVIGGLAPATPTPVVVGFSIDCTDTSNHDFPVTNEIFHDKVKLFGTCDTADNCTDPIGNNTMSHTTIAGAAPPLTLSQATSIVGPALRVGLTGTADADFVGAATIDLSALTETDNAVNGGDAGGAELKKGDPKTISITKHLTLVSSDKLPVTFELDTTITDPSGTCTASANMANPAIVVFAALGAKDVLLTYDLSCTAASTNVGFIEGWIFDEVLTSQDQHLVDGDTDTAQETVDIPVIEPFTPAMNIDQSSVDDPATAAALPTAVSQCLTTLGCEQAFYDSMGPADPFASVMYVDIPKTSPGYSIVTSGTTDGTMVVGELLGSTTIIHDPTTCAGSPGSTSVSSFGTVDITEEAAALSGALTAIVGVGTADVHYQAAIGSFAGVGDALVIDWVIIDLGTEYRQWRIVNNGDIDGAWATDTVCTGNIDYDLFGLVGAGPVNIRSCDDAGTHTFDTLWTRDDTGGTYTATEDLDCAAADVSVQLLKDEIVGDGNVVDPPDAGPLDFVDQGVTTTRDVIMTVAGPPDTILTASITGPVECAPRWVSPLDPAPSILGGIQTSVVTIDPFGAGAQVFTYEITCSPSGIYNLQIVANVSSVSAGAEANLLNNQAENVVQVIVNADNDGDGVDSPQDNCPSVPNPNQNDADSDGEGNACDINDDDDFVPLLANVAPAVVVDTVPIMDNPIAVADPFIPFGGPATIGPDQCNPGLDLFMSGLDLDALSAAELALWQEDNDDFAVEIPFPNAGAPGWPNFALDLDGCADTDMSVSVVKDETYDVDVSVNTAKTVTITVTNGNAAVGDATVNLLALSRLNKCEARWVAEAGDLSSEFQTDELTLFAVDGPGGADDYAPTPDGALDTLHSQLEVSTGPMAADEVLILTRDYTMHCYQPSTQLWWDSTPDGDYNFDATLEIQVDVLPDAPVVEENLADNVHKNFPLVTALAVVDLKYSFTVTGPTSIPVGVAVDVTGFNTIHNNGPSPSDSQVFGGFDTPAGCGLYLLSGAFLIPPGVSTGIIPVPLFQTQGVPLPPSIEVITPLDPGSFSVICTEPSFHTVTTTLKLTPAWPNQSGLYPETGEMCQNFVDDDDGDPASPGGDGIVNDGCPNHLTDPNDANNTTVFDTSVTAIAQTTLIVDVDLSAVPTTGNVSEDEFFNVVKTFSQQIDPIWNPFSPLGEDGVPAAGPNPPATPFGFFPCGDLADQGDADGADGADVDDCNILNLPNSPIFPLISETMNPPDDCAVSYHVTNDFLSRITGGAAGLTISVNGVVVDPPTPAGWEASDVVLGNPGDDVTVDFQISVTGGQWVDVGGGLFLPYPAAPTVITENWDKHCYEPSTHVFALSTSWSESDDDDPHLLYDTVLALTGDAEDDAGNACAGASTAECGTPQACAFGGNGIDDDDDGVVDDGCLLGPREPLTPLAQTDNFSEDILAQSDLKIVTDFFTDLTDLGGNAWLVDWVPQKGTAPETGNECQDSIDNDDDDVVNDGCPVEGHQKEALHNNGPYGPTAATVLITATASPLCGFSYDVRGDETSINGGAVPAAGTQVDAVGGVLTVEFPALLPVSTDVWFAELWRFSPDAGIDGCLVTIEKTVTPDDGHIIDDDGATFTKTVQVCTDNDGDGIHNTGDGACNGPDNCPDDANAGQEDADNDGLGDVCDPDPNRPPHDGVVKYVITIGPAAINLSDTTGRYMWIIAEVGNQGGPPVTESVTVTMDIAEDIGVVASSTEGCTRTPDDGNPANGLNEALVLPGQDTFTLLGLEQKFLVWRVRYECHTPATTQTIDQTVTVDIVLNGNVDGNPANDSQTVVKTVIIH